MPLDIFSKLKNPCPSEKQSLGIKYVLMALLFVCLAACSNRKQGYALDSMERKAPRTTVKIFTPMTASATLPLSAGEALDMTKKMHPKMQGLTSWKDIEFATKQSLEFAKKKPATAVALQRQNLTVTYGKLTESLQHLLNILPELDARPELLANQFTWYRLAPDFGFTGYYEPTLQASYKRTFTHNYPLYKLPPNIRKGVPYHSRNSIDRKGALQGKNLELAWVTSEVDAFFLHIQGSGRLLFPDGSTAHALYAGKNNQAYRALGGIMRDKGLIAPDNISMKSIRAALEKLPVNKQAELLDQNPSYVFFRQASQGPVGAMGRTLTPWVSLATDRGVLPHGTLTFVAVPLPDKEGNFNRPFFGLTLPQDTGGAIKGNRIDLFSGASSEAEHVAGHLDTKGAVFLLLKK